MIVCYEHECVFSKPASKLKLQMCAIYNLYALLRSCMLRNDPYVYLALYSN